MKPRVETIQAMWLSYQSSVVPKDASRNQVLETRRAFFAGAWGMLNNVLAMNDDRYDAASIRSALQALIDESDRFKNSVVAGSN